MNKEQEELLISIRIKLFREMLRHQREMDALNKENEKLLEMIIEADMNASISKVERYSTNQSTEKPTKQ